mgnify:CR=1 FL=1
MLADLFGVSYGHRVAVYGVLLLYVVVGAEAERVCESAGAEFERLVGGARRLGKRVLVRHNLTVTLEKQAAAKASCAECAGT